MKTTPFRILPLWILFFLITPRLHAQILNKVPSKVQETAEQKVLDKTDATLQKLETKSTDRPIGSLNKSSMENQQSVGPISNSTSAGTELTAYANYDFMPGDRLIYDYDMVGEKDAEIPGRLRIDAGNLEIQTYRGEKVLFIPANTEVYFSPLITEKKYLPEQYTVEFEILANGGLQTTTDASEISLFFREIDDTMGTYGNASAPIRIIISAISGDHESAYYEFGMYKDDDWIGGGSKRFPDEAVNVSQNNWRKVAVYVHQNIGKLYIDQHRIGMANQIETGKPAKLDVVVVASEHPVMLKNFRIAAGGTDAYKKVMQDGRFLAYGIRFDVDKTALRPESMGSINEFIKMMKEDPNLKFEIGGHTDSDGNEQHNLQLSETRAEMVRAQMVESGIAAERLSIKGYGSQNPVAKNDTAENKARNRRVEFVRK